jgi:hypothetical protein
VGLTVTALRRARRPQGPLALQACLDGLLGLARRDAHGLWWHNPAAPADRGVDLGLAHGVAGALWALLALREAGLEAEAAARDAAGWLLAHRVHGERFLWPNCVGAGASRLAWCYSDLGIAAALLEPARRLGHGELEAACREAALKAARLAPADAQVVDLGLCHGATGCAHLLMRLWQQTGVDALRERALELYRGVLARTAGPLEEWPTYFDPLTQQYASAPGLLTGVHGVMVGLHAAYSPGPQSWEEAFLLNVPTAVP